MTRKELCEIMAAGHAEASKELYDVHARTNPEHAHAIWVLVLQEDALAKAFRDLAKEQPDED